MQTEQTIFQVAFTRTQLKHTKAAIKTFLEMLPDDFTARPDLGCVVETINAALSSLPPNEADEALHQRAVANARANGEY